VGQVKALFQDEIESSSVDCEDCKGFGKVEVALAADNFREDDCETCQGNGRVEWED
jgi:DnaJ-class molecular chaperone|tara:strand:+ start:288 stop:455 length:168 start_codon:yes stop_codon:yes gene_type:complete